MTQLEELRQILTPPQPAIIKRGNSLQFVSVNTNPLYYYAKSFPVLFPFGRGCPSDVKSTFTDVRLHSQKMLRRGGGPQGRRFQQTPNYYFTIYSYLIKQRIGGIALLAQKTALDGTAQPENIPTIGEVNQLQRYLGSTTAINDSDDNQPFQNKQSKPHDMVQIKKLISRLVPYSKHMQGTEMGIRLEKRNLMALIPSPVVNAKGYWRWFITFAPADLYENRLFEITCKDDNENYTWLEKEAKVR